jgi:SNF2 family DNA or RNA helicase
MEAEMVGARIHVNWGQCNKQTWHQMKDGVKDMGGRYSGKGYWTLPLDLETCRRLRELAGPGDRLTIGPSLWEWAADERRKETNLTALTDISKIDVTAVIDLPTIRTKAPTMWAAMQNRPYQPVASQYMALATRCLNADQPGIGKTIETLGALIERGVTGPILILAPKTSCLTVWPVEIERWLGSDVPHTVTQTAGLTPAKRQEAYDAYNLMIRGKQPAAMHFLISNAEQAGIKKFTECPAGICDGDEDWCPGMDQHVNKSEKRRPFLHGITWNAIVADETHKWLINTRGKQASQVGYGFTRLKVADNAPMYALSGTPLKGKKWNLFGTLNWLWPKTYSSKWRWIGSYFEVLDETKNIGRRGDIQVKTITGKWKSRRDEQAFYRALGMVMIRRTKDELRAINPAWMPPEKRYHDVWVTMEPSQRTHYNQMFKAAAATLEGGRLTATGVLAELTRLKQFANSDGAYVAGTFKPVLPSAKFTWLLDFLEERGIESKAPNSNEPYGDLSDDVRKVVVASQFTSLIDMWADALEAKGIRCVSITGATKDRDRALNMERFQMSTDIRVMLINTNAGGVSITLDAADDMVIMDETWVPDDQEQVEDRVHRASNVEHQVDVWYVRTKGTVEEDIAKTNETKAFSNHTVLDAQRGLRFAAERFGATVKEDK